MERPTDGLNVAIVGATGVVGRELLTLLEERSFPVARLRALASPRSAGRTVAWCGEAVPVEDLASADFAGVDVAFFSAGGDVSLEHARRAAAKGAVVIDNSSAFRMDEAVPLVVPQVNADDAFDHRGIIANPNCSTILLVVALAPLERRWGIRRVVCSTYQAVSGSGQAAIEELARQASAEAAGEALEARVYPKPIHGNVLPFVQAFGEDDLTLEEWKMVHETRRILGRPDLGVSATCVRVPVKRAHSEAVNVELKEEVTPDDVRACLREADGLEVVDDPAALAFPTPREAEGRDAVLVGRIRRDPSRRTAVDVWLTGDQVRKGAALNALEIAELLLRRGRLGSGAA